MINGSLCLATRSERVYSLIEPLLANRFSLVQTYINLKCSFQAVGLLFLYSVHVYAAKVRNLGVTCDPRLSFSNHISNLSRSCFMHIREIRRIRPMLDFKTASIIATSIVDSKLDYCNSLFLSLDSTQIHCLQLIQNSLARAVTRTPRHHHITPVLKSLHWLKIPERIHFKVLSLTYNYLQFSKPTYLRELFTIQPTRSTRSSSSLTLSRPSVP